MWYALIAFVIVGIIIFIVDFNRKENERIRQRDIEYNKAIKEEKKKRETALNSKYGKCTRRLCRDENHNYTIRIYEESQVIAINDEAYNFADIMGCEALTQPKRETPTATITTTDNGNMAVRAAVGGMVLGPVGALAGAITAKKKTKVDEDETLIRELREAMHDDMYRTGGVTMFLKSISTPEVFILCYKNEEQEICSVINAIIAITQSKEKN
jgi:hypothetical protein